MAKSRAAAIAEWLSQQVWTWTKKGNRATFKKLGWKKIPTKVERDDYQVEGAVSTCAYFEDQTCDRVEIDFLVFMDPETLSLEEFEEKAAEFFAAFQATTDEIAEVLGPPKFSDGAAARGFPDDQEAVWLSLWEFPSARIMLQQQHADRELPMRLLLVVAPPA